MSEKLKAIIERSKEMWNIGALTIADEIFAEDFVIHYPSDPSFCDLKGYKNFVSETHKNIPDFNVKIVNMIAEDDKLACRWEVSVTHKVDFFGIPVTGKKATWTGITAYRHDSGKIKEALYGEDALGMLQHLSTAIVLGH